MSYAVNIFILMILYDFCLLPEQFCCMIVYTGHTESTNIVLLPVINFGMMRKRIIHNIMLIARFVRGNWSEESVL
jgi:hypothetical protein